MLRSNHPREHFNTPQLREVICQLRFPAILSIDTKEPADFQEAIRAVFPRYALKQDRLPPKLTVVNGTTQVENQPTIPNHHFLSADNKWKLNLTRDFISLSTLSYPGWEEFAQRLDLPLAQFIRLYQPAFFRRIGLRYVNLFSRRALGLEGEPWSALVQPPYLGILSQEDVREKDTAQCTVAFDTALDSSCRVKVHAGPGLVKQTAPNAPQDTELKFILDMDLFLPGETPPSLAAGALETLHGHSTALFEGAITEKLRTALRPR